MKQKTAAHESIDGVMQRCVSHISEISVILDYQKGLNSFVESIQEGLYGGLGEMMLANDDIKYGFTIGMQLRNYAREKNINEIEVYEGAMHDLILCQMNLAHKVMIYYISSRASIGTEYMDRLKQNVN